MLRDASNLAATPQSGVAVNGNIIQATSTFTRSDGSTGAIGSVAFNTDPFHSEFDGDTSISADAAAMPDLKGYGTLSGLRVAMTLDPSLIATINANLPNLDLSTLNLANLRQAVMPILSAWAAATPERDADGSWHSVTPSARPGIAILTTDDGNGNVNLLDFAYQTADGWVRASGTQVRDANGNVITNPTLQQVLDETEPSGQSWSVFTGAEINFMERYMGVPLPLDATPDNPSAMLQAMKSFVSGSITALNLEGVRLLMQGPLKSYFAGIVYDPTTDKFRATSDQQLAPMYEQIFSHAPGDPAAAQAWVASWKDVLDIVMGDLDRGGLMVSYGYTFASMVHAYETVGLPISITQAAEALGVPAGKIIAGGADLEGTSNPDIFYMAGGDQVARGGDGPDDYVVGQTFGHDVIDDSDGGGQGSGENADILRLTGLRSTDVTAERNGLDLIIHVNGDPSRDITVLGEFTGIKLGLTGTNMNPDRGVAEITFADGVVWDKPAIANAVSHVAPVNGVISGTPDNDVLDPGTGAGNVTMIGGDGGDIYVFGRGYGHDTIDDQQAWVYLPAADGVRFGAGITADDVTFSRVGNSNDLDITINGTTDELTILSQFQVSHNVIDSEPGRIEEFGFSDGTVGGAGRVVSRVARAIRRSRNDCELF